MASKKKPANPIRRSTRLRGQSTAGSDGAVVATDEIEVTEGGGSGNDDDSAADQLVQEMNKTAGKSPKIAKGNAGSLRRTPRKRDLAERQETDTAHGSPSRPQMHTSRSRSEAIRVEVPLQQSPGRLKRLRGRPKSAANLLQRDVFEFSVDEAGSSSQPKKIRRLNQPKVLNPSPLRKHGVIDLTDTRGVNLDDTSTTARITTKRIVRTQFDTESDQEFVQRSKPGTGDDDEVEPALASGAGSGAAEDSDHTEGEVEAAPPGGQTAPDESDQEEREREDLIRRYCTDAEPHIEVFGCVDDWRTLLVAGHKYRKSIREYVGDQPKSGISRKYEPRTEVGKHATEALDRVLELYEDEVTDWSAAAAAVTTAERATKLIQENENASKRGLDLHLSVLPRFVPILKAILIRTQPTTASTSAQLALLTRMLEYTMQVLEKARGWNPRPKAALDGYKILSLIRDEYAPSVRGIQKAYREHLDAIKVGEEVKRAELMHEERIAHQKEMDRFFREEKERRIQAGRDASERRLRELLQADRAHEEWKAQERIKLEAARKQLEQQQRRPLEEITRKIVGSNEYSNERPGRAIYQDPEEAGSSGRQEPWTQAEDAVLLEALMKEYQAENRFSMIHRRHGSGMPGRSVEDIRRQATVIKHNLADMIEALPAEEKKYWNFMKTIPG